MKLKKYAILFLALTMVALAACSGGKSSSSSSVSPTSSSSSAAESGGASQSESQSASSSAVAAPDFTVALPDGSTFTLSEQKGKVVFINFWATWCPYCVKEMPDMQTLYEKYGGDDFEMIAVSSGEKDSTISDFISAKGYTYLIGHDTDGTVASTYGVQSIPATVIVDTEGNVTYAGVGMLDYDTMESLVLEALGL